MQEWFSFNGIENRQLNDFGNFDIFYLLQVSFPVSTWLLFKVEEESLESRQLLCGILAQVPRLT